MKKILKSLFAAGVMLVAVGCNQDQIATTFNPAGEDASAAWFAQKAVSQEFSTTATGEQTIYVDIYRQNNDGDMTAGLWYEMGDGAAEFLSVPESIFFANGEFKATIPVTVSNVENFSKGTTYTVTLGVGDHHEFEDVEVAKGTLKAAGQGRAVDSNQYSSITVSTSLELLWEPLYILKDPSKLLEDPAGLTEADYVLGEDGKPMLQTGIYYDWGFGENGEVELQRAAGTTVFRMFNVFDGACNLIFTVDTAPSHMLTIGGKQYYSCVLTAQDLGLAYDATTNFWVTDLPSYAGPSYTYADYPCFWDGAYTFYFTLYWHVPGQGGWDSYSEPGDILVLDAGVPADPEPEVAINYEGRSTSATGIDSYSLTFEPNADAAKYYATVFKMDIEAICGFDYNTLVSKTISFLAEHGVTPSNPNFGAYFNTYFPMFLEDAEANIYAALESEREAVVGGEYTDFPVLELQEASTEAWALNNAGMYTAVAYSYDKSGEISGLDYFVFLHNPEGLADAISCTMAFDIASVDEPYASAEGMFADNAFYAEWRGGKNIVSVKYALLTAEEYAAAGFTDASTDADYIAYLAKNGKSLSAADLQDVNDVNVEGAFAYMYLPAKPATEYYFISAMSDADATKVAVASATTENRIEGSFALNAFAITYDLDEDGRTDVYAHTDVVVQMSGSHVCAGDYLIGAATSFKNYLVKGSDGSFSLAEGVTNEDIIKLIEENGSALTAGYTSSDTDLMLINTYGYPTTQTGSAKPNTEYYAVACYDLTGEGCKAWIAKSVTTDYAPAVAFTQSAAVDGKNLIFNWQAAPSASIFAVTQVDYALVKKADLEAAGADLTKLEANDLNDFAAQLAAGGNQASIEAAQANAEKILSVLAANKKVFQGDAAYLVNTEGVTKQFSDMEAGDYALISVAYDRYNTKLSVSLASIQ